MAIIKKFRIKSFKNHNSIVEFKNISLSYGKRLILDNINFKINEGEIFGMLGPNGVGKSTIFNLLVGLISPNSGTIKINNSEVNDYPVYLRTKKFRTSYCPQYGGFFGDLTLLDNLKAISEIVIDKKNLRQERINFLISRFVRIRSHLISSRLFKVYVSQPYPFFLDKNSAEMGKTILTEVEQVVGGCIYPSLQIIAQLLISVSIVIAVIAINPLITFIPLCVILIMYGIIVFLIRNRTLKYGEDRAIFNAKRYKITQELSNNFESEIKLNYTHDQSLIGGLVVQIGSTMIDTSIKKKLQQLETRMIEA